MSNSAGPIYVLHVDDHPDFAELTAQGLERENDRFSVRTATSAAAGRDALAAANDIDCIVSDYEIPGQTGIEFLETVREDYPDLPFILYTGKGSEEIAAEAISAGVTDYLQKEGGTDQYAVLANRIQNAVQQYRAEQTAAEMERRYRALFERSDEAIAWVEFTDATPVIRDVNPTFRELFDPPAEIAGADLDQLVAPSDEYSVAAELSQAVQSGRSVQRRVTRQTAAGTQVLSLRAFPVWAPDDDGVQSAFAMYTPLSEEAEHEQRLRTFVEQSTDIITVLEPDGTVRYQSPSVEHILGYDQEALVGENAFAYIHPDDRAEIESTFEAAVSTPDWTPTVEYRFRDADGDWTWVESRGNNQLDNPIVEGFVVNTREIANRVARERELERVQRHMEFALRSTDAIVWDWNVDEDHATFHPAEDDLFGTSVDSWDDFINLVHPDDRQTVRDGIDRALDTGEPKHEEVRIIDDGEVRWMEAPGEPIEGDDGATHMIGVARDITERKRRERELQQQNDRLEQFTNVVSHDLRNPLNVAQGRLELARADCTCGHDHLETIDAALERMDALITDLLALAREGNTATDVTTVDLAALAEACWQTIDTAAATLTTDVDQGVRADKGRLRTLLENLIRNAVEHGGTDVTVRIGTIDDGLYVADDGPGIPPDDRDAVFEAGYSTHDDGTGFGLQIVKQVVDAHDWTIDVTASASGGARFEITGVEMVHE